MASKKQHGERPFFISARCAHHLPPPSKHMKKLVFGLPTELLQLLLVTTGWLQTELGQARHSQYPPLFYSEGTTHHTKPEQDVAPAIYSANIPTAQEENEQ